MVVLETQLDDISPQALGYLGDRLLAAGALDYNFQPVYMKKGRPGHRLEVLCLPDLLETCARLLFAETPTLGLRYRCQERWVLPRSIAHHETPWGWVRFKTVRQPDGSMTHRPEYEDCAAIARQQQRPWYQIHQELVTWAAQHWNH